LVRIAPKSWNKLRLCAGGCGRGGTNGVGARKFILGSTKRGSARYLGQSLPKNVQLNDDRPNENMIAA
jgi:hypothetical protein